MQAQGRLSGREEGCEAQQAQQAQQAWLGGIAPMPGIGGICALMNAKRGTPAAAAASISVTLAVPQVCGQCRGRPVADLADSPQRWSAGLTGLKSLVLDPLLAPPTGWPRYAVAPCSAPSIHGDMPRLCPCMGTSAHSLNR
jgi:hypothetical protein